MRIRTQFFGMLAFALAFSLTLISCPGAGSVDVRDRWINEEDGDGRGIGVTNDIYVMITGIPSRYNLGGTVTLVRTDDIENRDSSAGDISGGLFYVDMPLPVGYYYVRISLAGEGEDEYGIPVNFDWSGGLAQPRNFAVYNSISFSDFISDIYITLTDIPSEYVSSIRNSGVMVLAAGAGETAAAGIRTMTDDDGTSSATFRMRTHADISFTTPGTYGNFLSFGFGRYLVSSRSITEGINTIPWSAFATAPAGDQQVAITVTDIPDRYIDSDGFIALQIPGVPGGSTAAFSSEVVQITGSSATFTMRTTFDLTFYAPWTYRVFLGIIDDDDYEAYVSLRNIVSGANTIPFSAFGPEDTLPSLPASTITVTGIPAAHNDSITRIDLINPATGNSVDYHIGMVLHGSFTANLGTIIPANYIVRLEIFTVDGVFQFDTAPRSIVPGTNTISWGTFGVVTNIIVDGMGAYNDRRVLMELLNPATNALVAGGFGTVTSGTLSVGFTGVPDADYIVRLDIEATDYDSSAQYGTPHSLSIATGVNFIWFGNFFDLGAGDPITIVVSGIPAAHNGRFAQVELLNPVTNAIVSDTWGSVFATSLTVTFGRDPANYIVRVIIETDDALLPFMTTSRALASGVNAIPWSAFTPAFAEITFTGIHADHNGLPATASLLDFVTREVVGGAIDSGEIESNSLRVILTGIETATYVVRLDIYTPEGMVRFETSPRVVNMGTSSIPWTAFTPVTTVTVSGLSNYAGLLARVEFIQPATGTLVPGGGARINDVGTLEITAIGLDPAEYIVRLNINVALGNYRLFDTAPRDITITGTNPVSLNDFVTTVQVTGIPSEHNELYAQIELFQWWWGGTAVATSIGTIEGGILTVTIPTVNIPSMQPGQYSVRLTIFDSEDIRLQTLERSIDTIGINSIPWSAFELVEDEENGYDNGPGNGNGNGNGNGPVSINITVYNVPPHYHGIWAGIHLLNPDDLHSVASGPALSDHLTTITLTTLFGFGYYYVLLAFDDHFTLVYYKNVYIGTTEIWLNFDNFMPYM